MYYFDFLRLAHLITQIISDKMLSNYIMQCYIIIKYVLFPIANQILFTGFKTMGQYFCCKGTFINDVPCFFTYLPTLSYSIMPLFWGILALPTLIWDVIDERSLTHQGLR